MSSSGEKCVLLHHLNMLILNAHDCKSVPLKIFPSTTNMILTFSGQYTDMNVCICLKLSQITGYFGEIILALQNYSYQVQCATTNYLGVIELEIKSDPLTQQIQQV